MANHLDVLASIEGNLQQAIQRKKPRELTVKFELDGQVRACCLSKSFIYADLLKAIQQLFGRRILPSVDTIRCSLSRDDTLRLPINNDEDLKQILMIAKTTGTTKLNFIITKNPVRTVSRLISVNSEDDADSICNDQETLSEPNNTGLDSPPPGTIVRPKPRRMSRSAVPNEGGRFIPESNGQIFVNGNSAALNRESSNTEHLSKRPLTGTSFVPRTASFSNVSASSTLSTNSCSSQGSSRSNESAGLVSPASPPQTPSNWKLGRQLGHGAFGKVYLCYDVDTGSELAIKQIPISGQNSKVHQEVKILECELNVCKQLEHERIVRYYGAVRTNDYLQIFMEYMTGGSVREQILNYGALTEQLTKKYTRQILEGLIYLHENRIVHRDIKCANILRDISGNVKLGDFGTSRRLISITNQNQPNSGTIGTAHWTAPEIIQGSICGRRADIWSLGCTVVEMLTAGPPWQNLQPIAAIFHIATCVKPEYQLPDNVSKVAKEFIDMCLTRDYHRRPTADDLIHHAFVTDNCSHHPFDQKVNQQTPAAC